jgi:hypothetical protein
MLLRFLFLSLLLSAAKAACEYMGNAGQGQKEIPENAITARIIL